MTSPKDPAEVLRRSEGRYAKEIQRAVGILDTARVNRRQAIRSAIEGGMKQADVARTIGVTRERVRQILTGGS